MGVHACACSPGGHLLELPNWVNAFQLLLLVQPSSAAAERAFSLLENSFNHQQRSSHEDYITVSVMLHRCIFLCLFTIENDVFNMGIIG